ncbi:MAG: hypothetical protein AB1921_18105 [Thermodesulfobacteriota bacterium]
MNPRLRCNRVASWLVLLAALALCRPYAVLPASPLKKVVTKNAGFAAYLPDGWTATETSDKGLLRFAARDAGNVLSVSLAVSGPGQARDAVDAFRQAFSDLLSSKSKAEFADVRLSPDRSRLAVSGRARNEKGGISTFLAWAGREPDGSLVCSRIAGPPELFPLERPPVEAVQASAPSRNASTREILLTVLANVRPLKGAVAPAPASSGPQPLAEHRLSDGSASFSLPKGWKVRELGAGCFLAQSPDESLSFLVASPEVIDPRLGVRPPGIPVSPFLAPHQAMAFLLAFQNIGQATDFLEVSPRQDLAADLARSYTAGPAVAEDFIYLVNAGGKKLKAFSFGISFGSRMNTSWRLFHMSVFAPEAEFASLAPTFAAMMQSYRVNDRFAQEYIRKGMERLRQMERETAARAARNASEIREMMQKAYDERQKSQDYIDYQRSNYIRGQQDWVSEMEGGTVYHTDSWGTRNTATGEYYEGAPYDYVHMTGRNPVHDERMTPINSRELYEQHVR